MAVVVWSAVVGMALTLLGTRVAISWLGRHGFGQPIRVDGPTTHHVKRGIPTMGGVGIVVFSTVSYLGVTIATGVGPSASGLLLLFAFWACAAIGFLDDFIKVYQQDNRGLPGRWKMVGQAVTALAFGLAATQLFADDWGIHPASMRVSFVEDFGIKLPLVVVLLIIWFLMTGTSNATNLTDGADGLLAGASIMVFGAYSLINVWQHNQQCGSGRTSLVPEQCYEVRDPMDLAIICAAIAGACAGFLWWNAKPAKIIMGDVGSLALGAALAAAAIMTRTELLLGLIGAIFVLETLSVMLQVSWFKITRKLTGTGKRIFRITPIHHHFEHLGWAEVTVVTRFWIVAGVGVAAGLGVLYLSWFQ